MQDKKTLFSIGRAADYLGVSIDTLRRWEKAGKVSTLRSPGGHRYFDKEKLDSVFGKRYERIKVTVRRKTKEDIKPTAIETPSSTGYDAGVETYSPPAYPSPVTYDSLPTSLPSSLDRPIRDFSIPNLAPVRVIQEVRDEVRVESILTPPVAVSQIPPAAPSNVPIPISGNQGQKTLELSNASTYKILFFVSLIILVIISVVLIVVWKSSQQILSPIS